MGKQRIGLLLHNVALCRTIEDSSIKPGFSVISYADLQHCFNLDLVRSFFLNQTPWSNKMPDELYRWCEVCLRS